MGLVYYNTGVQLEVFMKQLVFSISSLALIAANIVPLWGVMYAGWNMFTIMMLYWLESAIIGFFTVHKMRKAEGETPRSLSNMQIELNGQSIQDIHHQANAGKLFLIPFFMMHYGGFMFVHLIFVIILFGVIPASQSQGGIFDLGGILLGTLSLILSHWVSYRANFLGRGEYKVVSAGQLFISPYPRIIVMHMTVILGGFFVQSAGQSVGALAILVFLKTVVDLGSHLFEHGQIKKRLI